MPAIFFGLFFFFYSRHNAIVQQQCTIICTIIIYELYGYDIIFKLILLLICFIYVVDESSYISLFVQFECRTRLDCVSNVNNTHTVPLRPRKIIKLNKQGKKIKKEKMKINNSFDHYITYLYSAKNDRDSRPKNRAILFNIYGK